MNRVCQLETLFNPCLCELVTLLQLLYQYKSSSVKLPIMSELNCIAECQPDKVYCTPLSSKAYIALEAFQGQSSLILKKSPYMMSLTTDFPSVKIEFNYILNNE